MPVDLPTPAPGTTPLTARLAGALGQGSAEASLLVARALARAGWHVSLTTDAPAQVRGGHTFQTISAAAPGSAAVPHVPRRDLDALVALNQDAVDQHARMLRPGGHLLFAGTAAIEVPGSKPPGRDAALACPIPGGADGHHDSAAPPEIAAALGAWYGLPFEALSAVLAELPADALEASRRSYVATSARLGTRPASRTADEAASPRTLLNGNEALAFGATVAGCRFVGAYPMTPATSISEWMRALEPAYGTTVVAAEDEIAAVTMAAGAAYAGARALTATSGGGLALMAEAIGFAAMAEIPLVVIDAMRPGPSTGMPTRTEQGDLLFAVHLAQGDIPHIVLAPGDVAQCFEQAWRAFNLADRYQCPVLILTDAHLATIRTSIPAAALDPASVCIERGAVHAGAGPRLHARPFERYGLTADGVSPRSWPGDPDGVHTASSYEHDAAGHIAESAANRVAAMDRRLDRLAGARDALAGPTRYGPPEADVTLVSWGSTTMACRAAVDLGQSLGYSVNLLQFVDLWPFPAEAAVDALRTVRRALLVEQNATGQLGSLLRAETGIELEGRLLKYDGRSLTAEEILERGLSLARAIDARGAVR